MSAFRDGEAPSALFGSRWRLRDPDNAPEGVEPEVVLVGVQPGTASVDPAAAGAARELLIQSVDFGTVQSAAFDLFEKFYEPAGDVGDHRFIDDLDNAMAHLEATA